MPSLVTGVIGGIQGASASHHAAEYMQKAQAEAGKTVTDAVSQVNPEILSTAAQQGENVTAAGKAAGEGATSSAADLLKLLAPYIGGGSTAMGQLGELTGPGGAMSQPFTASMMSQYSPAYQFQLQQGLQQGNRAAAAQGLTGAGGTLKSLNRYTQDYAGTAFERANNIYQQQKQQQFNQLATLAGMGQTAATTGGQAGLQAAEYSGTATTAAAQWAGGANINARNLTSSNTLSGANYLANTQIGAGQAHAQGDLGAAASWNGMLGSIGKFGDSVMMAGLGGAPGTTDGWSIGNIGKNLWGGGGGGMVSSPAGYDPGSYRPPDWGIPVQ